MLQNQPTPPSQLFRTSLRSWRANYLAQRQAQPEETPTAEPTAAPTRVKRLAPRKRKKRQATGA